MIRLLIFAVCLYSTTTIAAVPTTNLINWTIGTYVGVPTGIVARTTIYTNHLASYGSAALQVAVNNCPADQVIQLETNVVHWLTNNLIFSQTESDITLRGGVNCKIQSTNNSSVRIMEDTDFLHGYPSLTNKVVDGVLKGSTNIVVTNVTDFAAGKIVVLAFRDNTNHMYPANGWLRQERKVIKAVSGNTVTVWPPLYSGYESGVPAICALIQEQVNFVGLENIYLDGTGNTGLGDGLIYLQQAYGCWLSNVVVTNVSHHAIQTYDCLFFEMRNCFVRQRQAGGPNGSGLLLGGTSGALIEDNVMRNIFPLVEVWQNSSGNVIGYNFFYDPLDGVTVGGSLNINHGGWQQFNLYEGNFSSSIQSDGFFTGSGHNTVFRNWFHGIATGNTNTFVTAYGRGSRYDAQEGNILGLQVTLGRDTLGQPNIGNSDFFGTSDQINGIYQTNYWVIGVITNRTDADTSEVQLLDVTRLPGLTDNWWPIGVFAPDLPYLSIIGSSGYLGQYSYQLTMTNLNRTSGNLTLENHNAAGGTLPANGTTVRLFFGSPCCQELDLSVSNTMHRAENYYFPGGIPADQQTGGLATNSHYRATKHISWTSAYNLGGINPASVPLDMTLTNYVITPSQFAFLNGRFPVESDAITFVTNAAPRIRGIRFR